MNASGRTLMVPVVLCVAAAIVAAQSPASQWDGVYTEEQAQRGEPLYSQYCASCHGADLLGVPQVRRYPGQPDRTPALVGPQFANNWNDLLLGDLLERIRISMPQDAPGALSRRQNAAILAYMLKSGRYPPGDREIPEGALPPIKFFATRP
jgi:S-disulfanyl-L-cysteine oxidoreductase SoxD